MLSHLGEAAGARPHGSVPASSAGLSLFRFEGATLRGCVPGDVPSCLEPACRVRVEPSSDALLGRRSVLRAGRRPLAPCVPWSGCSSRLVPFGLFGEPGRDVRPRARAGQPLENSKASTSIFVLQATKSQRRMPWRLKPKKDVGDCEKPREAVYQASIRGCPNGATQHLS